MRAVGNFVVRTFLFFVFCTLAHGQYGFVQDKIKLSGVAIPFYQEPSKEIAAVIRIDEVFVDHQRQGFFKIGLFPIIVGDGVTIEAKAGVQLTNTLGALHWWLKPHVKPIPVEVRNFTLKPWSKSETILKAKKLCLGGKNAGKLFDVTLHPATTNQIFYTSLSLADAVKKLQHLPFSQ